MATTTSTYKTGQCHTSNHISCAGVYGTEKHPTACTCECHSRTLVAAAGWGCAR